MQKGVIMQYFEWNLPNDGKLWEELKNNAEKLSSIGITAIWIPPACKSFNTNDVGYGIYDLFDLGEFYQKRSIRTKYGTKKELIDAIEQLHSHNIAVYFDIVINHKAGADYTENIMVNEVAPTDRSSLISDAYQIKAWTGFDFPARNHAYSDFKWTSQHFTGIDLNQANGKKAIYLIKGKSWSDYVDPENGNYDYLMYADIDFKNPLVRQHIIDWAIWLTKELNIDGIRLDAVKHIDCQFIKYFLDSIRNEFGDHFYAVGEYWKTDIDILEKYLSTVPLDLFDIPLHFNMYQASKLEEDYDLRYIFDKTLVKSNPNRSVTFVDNHDSQIGSSLESHVKDWFKPHAYAVILLMKHGYPCVFYGDYYGIKGLESPHKLIIDTLLEIRYQYAYGDQNDYFDDPHCIGFVRLGDEEHSGLVLLISNGTENDKKIHIGTAHIGEIWYEYTGSIDKEVEIDKEGNANFSVQTKNIAVWVKKR